ncbi:hypothetical protein F383_31745 [Gossypium arboreum]|uniref:Uncharacterized protein n=1 Tax=Gossypium arboreum TaxID=29729 RepID=A0A0B0MUD8_GOSAR|nr:hypothetical protein F383_31745 [Gossypium arboreum]
MHKILSASPSVK